MTLSLHLHPVSVDGHCVGQNTTEDDQLCSLDSYLPNKGVLECVPAGINTLKQVSRSLTYIAGGSGGLYTKKIN